MEVLEKIIIKQKNIHLKIKMSSKDDLIKVIKNKYIFIKYILFLDKNNDYDLVGALIRE